MPEIKITFTQNYKPQATGSELFQKGRTISVSEESAKHYIARGVAVLAAAAKKAQAEAEAKAVAEAEAKAAVAGREAKAEAKKAADAKARAAEEEAERKTAEEAERKGKPTN